MKRSIRTRQFTGFTVASIVGTLLHFLYDWLGGAKWIAPFSGVNESTWEHMKLLFWPMFIYSIVQGLCINDREDFWCIKLRTILLGLSLIPIIFYTYNGVIGRSPDWLNISIFFISAAAAYFYEGKLWESNDIKCRSPKTALILLCIIGLLFALFTFRTPELAIFRDPLTDNYGI